MIATLTTLSFYAVFVWLVFLGAVGSTIANALGKFPHLWVSLLLTQLFIVLVLVGTH